MFAIGIMILLMAGGMAMAQVGSPQVSFRVGVVGYLFVLFGGAGYITLRIARSLDGV